MPPGDSTVLFRALPKQPKITAENKRALQSFIEELAKRVGAGRAFTCLITNDSELRKLNREFLKHDYATDVLSFPPPAQMDGSLGDVAISAQRAEAQAREFGHSLMDEIRILMLHGILHLTGMDHQRDQGEMARAEQKLRREFKLAATLISRAQRSQCK